MVVNCANATWWENGDCASGPLWQRADPPDSCVSMGGFSTVFTRSGQGIEAMMFRKSHMMSSREYESREWFCVPGQRRLPVLMKGHIIVAANDTELIFGGQHHNPEQVMYEFQFNWQSVLGGVV